MSKRHPMILAICGAFIIVSVAPSCAGAEEKTKTRTLYERLGGYDGISAVVDDFASRLFKDPKINQFFIGMSDDSRLGFRQKNKNLLVNATGGPAKVISRPAKITHGGLGITEGDFKVVADHLKEALDKYKVPKREQDEVFAIILSLKPDIVERKTKKLSRDLPR